MKFSLKLIAAAAALASAGMANAALQDQQTGNSSMLFVLVDNVGSTASYTADLGYFFSDFAPGGTQLTAGTTIQWNFNNNQFSVNGVNQAVSYNWSGEFADFVAGSQAAETTYGVLGGDANSSHFLTTGNPTAAQRAGQDLAGVWDMSLTNGIWSQNTSIALATNSLDTIGANTHIGSNAVQGYVGAPDMLGANLNWVDRLNWQATVAPGTTSAIHYVTPEAAPQLMAGTFAYSAGVLTYSVAAVPEGDGLALLMAGLGALGFAARRRQAR